VYEPAWSNVAVDSFAAFTSFGSERHRRGRSTPSGTSAGLTGFVVGDTRTRVVRE